MISMQKFCIAPMIAAALLAALVLCGGVSADEIYSGELGFGETTPRVIIYDDTQIGGGLVNMGPTALLLNTNIKHHEFIMMSAYSNRSYSDLTGEPDQDSYTLDAYIGTTKIGTANWNYQYNYATTPSTFDLFVYLDNLDVDPYSGVQLVTFKFTNGTEMTASNFWKLQYRSQYKNTLAEATTNYLLNTTLTRNALFCDGGGANVAIPSGITDYYLRYYYPFRNFWGMSKDGNGLVTINVSKTIFGDVYNSQVSVYGGLDDRLLFRENIVNPTDLLWTTYEVPLRLSVNDSIGLIWNTSRYFDWNTTYTITASPDPVGVNGTITFTATSSAGWDAIYGYSLSISDTSDWKVNGYDPTWVRKSNNHWYQWDGSAYTIDWGTSFPSVVTTSLSTPGDYEVEAVFIDLAADGSGGGRATDTFTVTGTSVYVPITFRISDHETGNLIGGATLHLQNTQTDVWTNVTVPSGIYTTSVAAGKYYNYMATATGYDDSGLYIGSWNAAKTVYIALYETIASPAGYNMAWVTVTNATSGAYLSGATVKLSDGQAKTTGSSGIVKFNVTDGDDYKITVSKTGYIGQSRWETVSGTTNKFSFELEPDANGDGTPDDGTGSTGGSGNYSSGALNEDAQAGIMEILDYVIDGKIALLAIFLLVLAALKRL